MNKAKLIAFCTLLFALSSASSWGAPVAKTKKRTAAPSTPQAAAAQPSESTHAPAPKANEAKQIKEGELTVESTGTSKQKMTVGKIDPPAAFNLEDIQNFPEDRLHPVLSNPITFEEGRDFSTMMEQDEKIIHPWLPEIAKAPYLTMKTAIDKPAKDWSFSVIDQGGTPVATQEGKGSPPDLFHWSGDDKERGHVAVDTVYIPQLATTDKEGYRHTYMGQPVQFASLLLKDKGRTIIEVSSKRVFLDKKSDFSKEAPVFLDKICDLIREDAKLPFAVQAYDADSDLGRARTSALTKYFSEKLYIPENQITALEPAAADKRGLAFTVTLNGTPGGAE